jgi:hypothetical protein
MIKEHIIFQTKGSILQVNTLIVLSDGVLIRIKSILLSLMFFYVHNTN